MANQKDIRHFLSVERQGRWTVFACNCQRWFYETDTIVTVEEVLKAHRDHVNPLITPEVELLAKLLEVA